MAGSFIAQIAPGDAEGMPTVYMRNHGGVRRLKSQMPPGEFSLDNLTWRESSQEGLEQGGELEFNMSGLAWPGPLLPLPPPLLAFGDWSSLAWCDQT